MRNRASALLILAVGYCLAAACCAPCCPAQKPVPPAVTRPNATFHSDSLALDFSYPSAFQRPQGATEDAPGKGGPEKSSPAKADAGCASVPLAVMDMSAGFNMIFVKRYDPSCQRRGRGRTAVNTRSQAVDFLRDSLEGFGRPTMGAPVAYDLAGHDAATVFGRVKLTRGSGTTEIYGAASCAVSGRNVACFEFLSDDCHKVAVLSASTVKFAGAGATPVLPARLVPACKP